MDQSSILSLQQPATAEQPELLTTMESSVRIFCQNTEFEVISPFADRGGAWELRLASKRWPSLGFISVACDELPAETRFRCEIAAGAAMDGIVERRVIGRFNLETLTPKKHRLLSTMMAQASQTSDELSQALLEKFPVATAS